MPVGTIEATPKVLAWVRTVAGLSLEDAAKRHDHARAQNHGGRIETDSTPIDDDTHNGLGPCHGRRDNNQERNQDGNVRPRLLHKEYYERGGPRVLAAATVGPGGG